MAETNHPIIIIDDDDGFDAEFEENLEAELENFVDLTIDEPRAPRRNSPLDRSPSRNAALGGQQILLQEAVHNGVALRQGQMVEVAGLDSLPGSLEQYKPAFFLIKSIIRDETTQNLTIRALPFTRTRYLQGLLPKKPNEICLVLEIDLTDDRAPEQQCTVEIELQDHVHCIKRNFLQTNRPFPEHCAGVHEGPEHSQLVCRWKYSVYYKNALLKRANKAVEWRLQHLRYEDAHPDYGLPDDQCRFRWRGVTTRGGSYNPNDQLGSTPALGAASPGAVIDLDNEQPGQSLSPGQKYTVGDIFAGAGGASRGIRKAGFHLACAVDHWAPACETYKLNFSRVRLHRMDVHDFIVKDKSQGPVDVLQLSPPCQYFSPAHTHVGKNDEANYACLFSCGELIRKLKPRLFTLEQTSGLLTPRFDQERRALISSFTGSGYSVGWKIVSLDTWGLPQTRRRLIMIGSCQGEVLPSFPEPTHGDGRLPPVTIEKTLKRIGPLTSLHDPSSIKRIDRTPYDPKKPLPRTICAGDNKIYHFSGRREFTERELASLNGFPVYHEFKAPGIKKQIGNAFPPCVVQTLYTHLLKHLKKVDNVESGESVVTPGSSRKRGEAILSAQSVHEGEGRKAKKARTGVCAIERRMVVIDDEDLGQQDEDDAASSCTIGRSELGDDDIPPNEPKNELNEDRKMRLDDPELGPSRNPNVVPSPARPAAMRGIVTLSHAERNESGAAVAIRGGASHAPIDLTEDVIDFTDDVIDLTGF